MSDTTIVFYDIPFAEPNVCWSPNTWKTRYCLNYKGLPYRTEWVEYPDIEALCKKIGAEATGVDDDGVTPYYTLPVIYDPTTNRVISESFKIAIYLDATYPDTPRVLPPGTRGLQTSFNHLAMLRTYPHVGMFVRAKVYERLPRGKSQEYFKRTREISFGKKIEEWAPKGEDAIKAWQAFENGLKLLDLPYQVAMEENEGDYLCGENPTFGDFALAGIFQWCKTGYGSDSEEWKEITGWQNGRWGKFLEDLDKYAKVV
ncbi:hypothetical protein GYMLUDRAFT_202224 [Collybiopsis luxurians FD-317 M1]|uniref:GST N-terminal domain-containing protein n=1 Tax=Collybiopsis luxurians FD-317 M1 TaxID=944289 RepID=A0A0D0B6E9_9AGAR|nr:hypothetical protein GYMLUDRAFT_202224 [Collybiopsis luxurians FD-317 M1]